MAEAPDYRDVVTSVILEPLQDDEDPIGIRYLSLTKEQPVIVVGRSSKNKSKNLSPTSDNAYFDSPVMSRLHAWIRRDADGHIVIADAQSMHGTYLNNDKLENGEYIRLEPGMTVRFGNEVARGSEVFPPKEFLVDLRSRSVPNASTTNASPLRTGYGVTSEDLVLPDSPCESESEDNDVVVTNVKVTTQTRTVLDNSFKEIPMSAVRDALSDDGYNTDEPDIMLKGRSVISCPVEQIDLTIGSQMSQSDKKLSRVSIADLIVGSNDKKDSSSHAIAAPSRLGNAECCPVVIDSDDDDEEESDYAIDDDDDDEEAYQEELNREAEELESASKTFDFKMKEVTSEKSNSVSNATESSAVPVCSFRPKPLVCGNQPAIEPEVEQAWDAMLKAPLLAGRIASSGGIRSIISNELPKDTTSLSCSAAQEKFANLASRTKIAMEQVRKADALRERAHGFFKSRQELDASPLFTSTKQAEPSYPQHVFQTQTFTAEPMMNNVAMPIWVQNFSKAEVPHQEVSTSAENLPNTDGPSRSPSQASSRSEGDTVSHKDHSSPLNTSPLSQDKPLNRQTEDDEFSDEMDEDDYEPSDSDMECHQLIDNEDYTSSDSEPEQDYPEEEDNDDVHSKDNVGDVIETDMEDAGPDFLSDDANAHASRSQSPVYAANKNPMSMENFCSPVDEPVLSSSFAWDSSSKPGGLRSCDVQMESEIFAKDFSAVTSADGNLFGGNNPHLTVTNEIDDLAPTTRKRKTADMDEEKDITYFSNSYPDIASRRIAPLSNRFNFIDSRLGNPCYTQGTASKSQEGFIEAAGEPSVTEVSGEPSVIELADEPKSKKARVSEPGWGKTLATAFAGAVFGGVGVFAALVATAGDI